MYERYTEQTPDGEESRLVLKGSMKTMPTLDRRTDVEMQLMKDAGRNACRWYAIWVLDRWFRISLQMWTNRAMDVALDAVVRL